MAGEARKVGRSWADVAVAHQRSVRAFEDFVQPVLARFKVPTLGVANVLFLVAVGRKGRRASEVMRNERYVGSNASYALDALEKAALVQRFKDPSDKRMRVVVPTAKGRRLIDEICHLSGGDEADVAMALDAVARFVSVVSPGIAVDYASMEDELEVAPEAAVIADQSAREATPVMAEGVPA